MVFKVQTVSSTARECEGVGLKYLYLDS